MIAKRRAHRRGWPPHLYEPRPGYYVWRNPETGATMPIGRVDLATAKAEAIAANNYVASLKPTLVEQLSGSAHTITDLIERMEPPKAANTAKSWRSLDKIIVAHFGRTPVGQIDVKTCADLIEILKAEKLRTAQAVRSRMVTLFKKGQQLGWCEINPASVTSIGKKVESQRERLTIETFLAIYAKADDVNEWLGKAMRLAMVTAADRSSILRLTRQDIHGDRLHVTRPKTKAVIAIPTHLTCDALGWTLADILRERTPVVTRYLVHHIRPCGTALSGSRVAVDTLSRAFMHARRLAGIPDIMPSGKAAPTFHEIRSLSIRTYKAQGGVDTQALAGHSDESMTAVYADPRGVEPIVVKVGNV